MVLYNLDAGKKWIPVATLRDGGGTVQDVEFAPNHLGLRLVREDNATETKQKGRKVTRYHQSFGSDLINMDDLPNLVGNCGCRWPSEDLRGYGRDFLGTLGLGR